MSNNQPLFLPRCRNQLLPGAAVGRLPIWHVWLLGGAGDRLLILAALGLGSIYRQKCTFVIFLCSTCFFVCST